MKTNALAQIEVESPELKNLIFLPENSDSRGFGRSSFYGLEKSGFCPDSYRDETESWISS
ncbi:hypothetical protein [Flavobacterium reichenbachii]|uniref:hypothetical protein n=1 Tax=Flavobacterium reichenbachii TaxID=362418 RepID=UPI000AE78EA6|nr:hypothetical protein [Flavobacterium reichenbachii]